MEADDATRLGITYEMRAGKLGHVRVYLGHERARDAASSGASSSQRAPARTPPAPRS
jgi:hypothetical protein